MKQLLILSGKGGTGKTTVATAFIALSSARAFADCDVDAPNLHLVMAKNVGFKYPPQTTDFMGMAKATIDPLKCTLCGACFEACRFGAIKVADVALRPVESTHYQVSPFLCEGCGVCQFVCGAKAVSMAQSAAGDLYLYETASEPISESASAISNLPLQQRVFSTAQLHMGSGTSGLLVSAVKQQMKGAVARLKEPLSEDALVVIDGSPGIGCPVIASVTGVDWILVVAEPSLSGFSDMVRIIETAYKLQTPLAVCVNKWDTHPGLTADIEGYCKVQNLPFVGCIPYDEAAVVAINEGRSVIETPSRVGDAVRLVYEEMRKLINS